MKGEWRPLYMRALHRLKDEVNREIDAAQVGDVREGDPLQKAWDAAMELR